jgi:hypothetical protein
MYLRPADPPIQFVPKVFPEAKRLEREGTTHQLRPRLRLSGAARLLPLDAFLV